MPSLLLLLTACLLSNQEDRDRELDPDGDGVYFPDDCDDLDPEVTTFRWHLDADGDGFGDPEVVSTECEAPEGYVYDFSDCDDASPEIHPGADEWCDGVDQDCDAVVDEAGLDPERWFEDADGDGYGLETSTLEACEAPEGYAAVGGDCDDSAASAYPGGVAVCGDGVDNDCDGLGDCGLALEGVGREGEERARLDGDREHPLHGELVAARDLTGDGVIDLLVGSRDGLNLEGYSAGVALLFEGPVAGRLDPEDALFSLYGEYTLDQVSASLGAADMDGDGRGDAVVGAPGGFSGFGAIYIALGPIIEDIELAQATSVIRLFGYAEGDELGAAMLVQDFDDDGAVDLLVGAPGASGERGALHYVEGPLARRSVRVDDVQAGAYSFSLPGARFGERLTSAGDVDGDGQDDVLVAMPEVVSQPIHGLGMLLTELPQGAVNANTDFRASFADASGQAQGFAQALTGAGDVDGDGFADVIVGAPLHADGGYDAGVAWLLPGDALRRVNGEAVDHEDIAVATLVGDTGAKLGAAAHGPGDLTGDGHAELLIGAPGYDNVGAMLLYQGPLVGTLGPDDADYSFEGVTSRTRLGAALGALDDLDGYGLPELFVAAPEAGDGALFILPADGL